ncbi:hypothetical protein AVEN_81344-1 [Araneus ventricosus]|uniref:Uncharacterized protein n=1 Tax=Araneus ventricosus TaxID=182803 RepID=A0A4Y2B6S4_ARAVE|nr:hypothetical protein AVEN_81344-1 [Araneus ventricosus]
MTRTTPQLAPPLHTRPSPRSSLWTLIPMVPLKQELFWRIRHELNSPNLGGHLPHNPNPCCNLPLRPMEMGCGTQGWLAPLPRLYPKRSQNLISPQKKPTASDRPSSLLRGNF